MKALEKFSTSPPLRGTSPKFGEATSSPALPPCGHLPVNGTATLPSFHDTFPQKGRLSLPFLRGDVSETDRGVKQLRGDVRRTEGLNHKEEMSTLPQFFMMRKKLLIVIFEIWYCTASLTYHFLLKQIESQDMSNYDDEDEIQATIILSSPHLIKDTTENKNK